MRKTASTTVPVHPLLAERWSPRGFDQAHEIGEDSLTALLEAARWAPSAQNSQPWRFLVTRRGEEAHGCLFAALAPGNQAWAGTASALILVAARTVGATVGSSRGRYTTPARPSPRSSPRLKPTDSPCTRWAVSTPPPSAPGSASATPHPSSHLAIGCPGSVPTSRVLAARETAPRARQPITDLLLPADPRVSWPRPRARN